MSGFSPSERRALEITGAVSGSVSMAGCVCVLVSYYMLQPEKRRELGVKMVVYEIYLDFFQALVMSWTTLFLPTEGADPSGGCIFQAFSIQLLLAAVLWNGVMAVNFYCLVVLHTSPKSLRKMLKVELVIMLVCCIIIALSLLFTGKFGNAGLWCWIPASFPFIQIGCFYVFVFIAWVISVCCLVKISKASAAPIEAAINSASLENLEAISTAGSVTTNAHSELVTAARESAVRIKWRLFAYVFAFIFIWIFGLMNRIVGIVRSYNGQSPSFATNFLHVLFVPMQGFLDALIYFGIVEHTDYFFKKLKNNLKHDEVIQEDVSFFLDSGWRQSMLQDDSLSKDLRKIFVTTFNMGESFEESTVPYWIPEGYDVYAVGVQECMDLENLRGSIMRHLNRTEEGRYVMKTNEIGSTVKSLG